MSMQPTSLSYVYGFPLDQKPSQRVDNWLTKSSPLRSTPRSRISTWTQCLNAYHQKKHVLVGVMHSYEKDYESPVMMTSSSDPIPSWEGTWFCTTICVKGPICLLNSLLESSIFVVNCCIRTIVEKLVYEVDFFFYAAWRKHRNH